MATTRRSTRLQNRPALEPADDKPNHDSPARAAGGKSEKPKTSGGKTAANRAATLDVAERGKIEVRERAAAGNDKSSKITPQPSSAKSQARISSLPPEVLSMILDNVTSPSTINALGRTCKTFYSLMMPRLYDRISVAAMYHAHIAKLIRTLEPHLTIDQKKKLKKEGKYKGQQENFPTGVDEKAKPLCAGHVRKLVVGVADPGKKHKYIVERYVEEAFKNMENLEIVETRVLTKLVPSVDIKSIGQSLASLANLKALRLFTNGFDTNGMTPLAQIKNLKHLDVQEDSVSMSFIDKPDILQSMLQNSRSSLQSLAVTTNAFSYQFLKDWEKNLKASAGSNITDMSEKGHDFTALKSLALSGLLINENFVEEFHKAIYFPQLRHLNLAHLQDTKCLFYPSLTTLATSYQGTTDVPINLRTLNLNMSDYDYMHDARQKAALFEAKCRFISSFDTLTTLELSDYGQYASTANSAASANPGLADTLLQAILKHKNLRVLKICYVGKVSGLEIPYLGAKTVGIIVDGLRQLREFNFAPDEGQMDEISRALLRGGSHLESITCFPHASWATYPAPDNPGANIISSILSAFLCNTNINLVSTSQKQFLWEDYYNLNQVSVGYKAWDIASDFRKRKEKSTARPSKIVANEADGTRKVWYRLVTTKIHIHVGYDPYFEWVSKVDKEID